MFKTATIVTLAVGIIIGIGCQVNEKERIKGVTPTETVSFLATLLTPKSEVHFRRARKLVWNEAPINIKLSSYDAVRTGPGSSAVIKYNDQTSLDMDSDTLIIILEDQIKDQVEKSVLALPKGRVEANLKKGRLKVELTIKTAGGWIKTSSDRISGKGDKAKIVINVAESGKVNIKPIGIDASLLVKNTQKEIQSGDAVVVEIYVKPDVEGKADYTEVPNVLESKIKKIDSVKTVTAELPPKNTVKKFRFSSPTNKSTVSSASVEIVGLIPRNQKAYLDGEKVKFSASGKFKVNVPLNKGINIITFQVTGPAKNQVEYISLEIIRI